MASPTVAANAYANLAKILDTGGAGKSSESGGGPSFSAPAQGRGRQRARRRAEIGCPDGVDGGRQGQRDGRGHRGGGTDVAVSTLVSVRDRVIQSYEDIMKMSI